MFPGLVESGKVFKAVPPLYGIPMGKNRTQYFAERVDFIRYMQKEYFKKNNVTYMNGKPVNSTTFSNILLNYSDYQYDFFIISERYKLNPVLLEIAMSSYVKKEKFETLRKRITSEFRFMENSNIVKVPGGTIRIKGLINGRVETLFYNDRFIKDCEPIIEPIKRAVANNQLEFLVNGQKTGLYDLVTSAMESIGSISRFKGLGEMNANQLAESTMSPDTRTLIQYSVNDINESIKIIRQYDSNKKMILQKIGDIDRSELIGL
jgi:DNA gyrase/topoisomerase IV subunit B